MQPMINETIEVGAYVSNYILHKTIDFITYSCPTYAWVSLICLFSDRSFFQ